MTVVPVATVVHYPPPCPHYWSTTIYIYDNVRGTLLESYQLCSCCGVRKP